MDGLRITKLERRGGHWHANVSVNGTTLRADCSSGSWQFPLNGGPAKGHPAREVRPDIAAELQARVCRLVRRERRRSNERLP